MAFDPDSLCVLSYARGRRQPRGFTHWYYWTEDLAGVLAPGYFDAAADLMRAGDVVFAAGAQGALQLAVVSVELGEKLPGQVYRQGGSVRVAEMCRDKAEAPNGSNSASPPAAA
jgi:hypothetical protein